MTLQAIIIRADGALAETEAVRLQAFSQVFSEAGFEWTCDRQGFALTAKLGTSESRMAHYVRGCLRGRPETEDISHLIHAMHRRAAKVFSELVANRAAEPRPGIRDLIVGARSEDLRLAVVGGMSIGDIEALLESVLGKRGADAIDLIVASSGDGIEALDTAYRDAAEQLAIGNQHCLVIEATRAGSEAARRAGLPVITTRSAYSRENLAQAGERTIIIDDLPSLVGPGRHPLDPLDFEERSELLRALHRLHAGNCESLDGLDWSSHMRVSDILKTKGAVVKSIEPTASALLLARDLKMQAVGALLVQDSTGALQGIVSERDLARGLDAYNGDLQQVRVADIMTKSVVTCAPEDSVAYVADIMTVKRIRHIPVVVAGKVVGMISIGDVLKHRLDEVQLEANVLRDVARARR